MRRALCCLLVGLLFPRMALCQQSAAPATLNPPAETLLQTETSSPAARPDEIKELRAAIARLQEQVNRLSNGPDPKAPPPETLSVPPALPATERLPAGNGSLLMSATWNNGLEIKSADDAFRVHVGGRLQLDSGWNAAGQAVQFGPGGTGELQDGILFRRARLRVDGTIYQNIDWVMEFDLANDVENDTTSSSQPIGSPSFTNVWIGFNELPYLGTVRIGWLKEPIGFEHLMSSRWLNFMENAPGVGSLGLRSAGVLLRNTSEDQRVTWSAGFFHVQNNNFGYGIGDGEYAETGRLTWLPWYEEEGEQLLHLGIGASHRHLADNQIDLHGRPSIRTMPGSLLPSLADTGTIAGSTEDVFGVELAGVCGPWTLQSEYFGTTIHDAVFPDDPPPQGMPRGTLFYQGCYVEVLYFLTGEHRAYNLKDAVFDRVVPLRNFNVWNDSEGWGAWQVGIRYAYLDLQNKGVNGATLNDIVLGLNWFLNPNMKVQWNVAVDYRSSTPPGSNGWTYIAGTRLAMDF